MLNQEETRVSINKILDSVYSWSRNQKYKGYNKHDALNSPILKYGLGWNKWARIFCIQSVMRFPVNIRPLLLIPKTYNPKGIALFALGLIDRYRASNNHDYLNEAITLLDLLTSLRSKGNWSGHCWGYSYPWQDLGFYAPNNTPNAVVTCFVADAFLQVYIETKNEQYLSITGSCLRFLCNDLKFLKDTNNELCISYMPLPMEMRVLDVSILIGSLISHYVKLTGENIHYSDTARRLLNYIINQQTDYGAWYYTDPPGDSPIGHDNYHTGFILDALWKYMDTTDNWEWLQNYKSGLKFYAEMLFNSNGSPRWMSDRDLPHDIHGAAQGILTFSRHSDEYALLLDNIVSWSIEKMYDSTGRFYYQEHRFYTTKYTLLRWCNAWIARSLSHYILYTKHDAYEKY